MDDSYHPPAFQGAVRAQPGTIVTYVDLSVADPCPFQRAVATGDTIVDPETKRQWLPVLRPDCGVFLVDPASIVDISLPLRGSGERLDEGPRGGEQP